MGVTFNNTHTSTWGLILTSTKIEKPAPKTSFIDIPFGDGSADLSEASGEVKYQMRQVVMEFKITDLTAYEALLTSIANEIHGQKVKITLDKDPTYYYYGRVSVEYNKDTTIGTIVVTALCDPYKYKTAVTSQEEAITTSKSVTIHNDRKKAYPKITTTASFSIVKDGVTYSYGTVTDLQTTIPLLEGDNTLACTGTGTITFEWQEGAL